MRIFLIFLIFILQTNLLMAVPAPKAKKFSPARTAAAKNTKKKAPTVKRTLGAMEGTYVRRLEPG